MDNKFVNGTMLNSFAKLLKSNIKSDLLGDKKLRYLTQAEYDVLTDDEKNDETIIYNITDASIEEGFSGDYNDLENRPVYDDREYEVFNYNNEDTTADEVAICNGNGIIKKSNTELSLSIDDIRNNIETFSVTMSMVDTVNGEETVLANQILSGETVSTMMTQMNEYVYAISEYVFFVFEDTSVDFYHSGNFYPVDLTQGVWLLTKSMNTEDTYLSYQLDLVIKKVISGDIKTLEDKFIPYKPGLKVTGKTYLLPNYENELTEEFIAEIGAEIFNDYENNKAIGKYAHAEGEHTEAIGNHSHAEGEYSHAEGWGSHAEGAGGTLAAGGASHAEGYVTQASGHYSHAEGEHTIAFGEAQHVQGRWNIKDEENKYAHIVGNGTISAKSNAHTLDWNGNAWFQGNVSVDGTPTNDKDLTTKKYVDDSISDVEHQIGDMTIQLAKIDDKADINRVEQVNSKVDSVASKVEENTLKIEEYTMIEESDIDLIIANLDNE